MTKIEYPLNSENLAKFYLDYLFNSHNSIQTIETEYPRNTKYYSKKALEELGLLTKQQQAREFKGKHFIDYFESYPVAQITYIFSDLLKGNEPTKERVSQMNSRIISLLLNKKYNPSLVLDFSQRLFNDKKLGSVIKAIFILASDYENAPLSSKMFNEYFVNNLEQRRIKAYNNLPLRKAEKQDKALRGIINKSKDRQKN